MAASGGNFPSGGEGSKGKGEGSKRVAESKKEGAEGVKAKVGSTPAGDGSMSAQNEELKLKDRGKQNKNATGDPENPSNMKKGVYVQGKIQDFQKSPTDEHYNKVSFKNSTRVRDVGKRKPDQFNDDPKPEPSADMDKNNSQQDVLDESFVIVPDYKQKDSTNDDVLGENNNTSGENQRLPEQSPDDEQEKLRKEKEEISKGKLHVVGSKSPTAAIKHSGQPDTNASSNSQGGEPDVTAAANIQIGEENGKIYKNDLFGTEEQSEDQTGVQEMDNDTLPESVAELSRSSSVETIEGEPEEENSAHGTLTSLDVLNSMTHISDDNRKALDNDKDKSRSVQRIDEQKDGQMKKENPVPHDLKDKDIKQNLESSYENKSTEGKPCADTTQYTLEHVGDRYLLLVNGSQSLKVPQLDGKSNVSLLNKHILIDNEPEYFILNKDGTITFKEVGEVKSEGLNNESLKCNSSDNIKNVGGELLSKVRSTFPHAEELLNPKDVDMSKADISHLQVSHDERDEVDELTEQISGLNLEGQQKTETLPVTSPRRVQTIAEQTLHDSRAAGTDASTNPSDISPPREANNEGQDKSESTHKPKVSPRKSPATPEQTPSNARAAATNTSMNPTGAAPTRPPRKSKNEEEVKFTRELVDSKRITEGSDLKLECCVSHPNLTVRWLKDGEPLECSERITAVSSEPTHSLEIQKVVPTDSGKYTVEVENKQSISTVTVEEKVKFTRELIPSERMEEGLDLKLKCCVTHPGLTASWFKDRKPLEGSKRIKPVSSGKTHSLEIQNVILSDSGKYTVKVDMIQSTSTVTIEEKPVMFTLPMIESIESQAENDVTLSCHVSKPDLVAKWTAGGRPVKNTGRFQIVTKGMVHKLVVTNVRPTDGGVYVVTVGELQAKCDLTVHEKPPAPKRFRVSDITSESCKLCWEKPDGSSKIKHYVVQLCQADKTDWMNCGRCECNNADIGNLEQNTPYLFRVAAVTGFGTGEFAELKEPIYAKDFGKNDENDEIAPALPAKSKSTTEWSASNFFKETDEKKPPLPTPRSKHSVIQERKVMIVLSYSRSTDGEIRTKTSCDLKDIETYMKWQFVLSNHGTFKIKAENYKQVFSANLTCEKNQLVIDLGHLQTDPDTEHISNKAIDHILSDTDNLSTRIEPLPEEEFQVFLHQIKSSSLGQHNEIVAFYDKTNNQIYLTYNNTQEKIVNGLVENLKKGTQKKPQPKVFKRNFIFRSLLESDEFSKQRQEIFPKVDFRNKVLEHEDAVLITLIGDCHDIDQFEKWFEAEYIEKYGKCKTSYKNMNWKEWNEEDQTEMLKEFLREKLKNDHDIKYDLNPVTKTVWICSEKSQERADEICNKVRKWLKEDSVLTEETVPYQENLSSKDVELMIKKITSENKQYIRVSVLESNIVIEGLAKHVFEMRKVIEKELLEADKSARENEDEPSRAVENEKGVFEISDISVYEYLRANDAFADLERQYEVRTHFTEDKKLLYVKGRAKNISEFEKEMQKLLERISSEVITLEGENMSFLDIKLHTINAQSQSDLHLKSVNKASNNGDLSDSTDVTLNSALRNAALMSWKLPGGHNVICTNKYVNNPREHMSIIPMLFSSSSGIRFTTSSSGNFIILPVQEKGAPKAKHSIDGFLKNVLDNVRQKSTRFISVYVERTKSWPKVSHIKPILDTLKRWLEEPALPQIVVAFTCVGDACKDCVDICTDAFTGFPFTQFHKGQEKKPALESELPEVNVIKKQINEVEADVIVNTTGKDLDLKNGAVSYSLLQKAGQKMQEALSKAKPHGISYGDIVRTDAFNLKGCKHVLHGALCPHSGDTELKKFGDFVFKCFEEADKLQCQSIAFPALGTGNLGYPKDRVAKVMFQAVQKYLERNMDSRKLKKVFFVVYGKDTDCVKEFQKQSIIWSSHGSVGRISYQLDIGSVSKPEAETLIYLWDKEGINYVRFDAHPLLKSCGKKVRDIFSEHRDSQNRHNMLKTSGGDIPVFEICHTPCSNSIDSIHQAMFDSLTKVNNMGSKSACIAFNGYHPFMKHDKLLAEEFIKVLENFSNDTKTLVKVVLMVETEKHLQSMIEPFTRRKLKDKTDAGHEYREVMLFGDRNEIVRAKRILKDFYKITKEETLNCKLVSKHTDKEQNSKPLAEPDDQSIDRGCASYYEELQPPHGNRGILTLDRTFETYVQLQNITPNITREKLAESLRSLPVEIKPKLVFCENETSALLLCHTKEDAGILHGFAVLRPLTFQKIEAKSLSNITKRISQSFVDLAKENKQFHDFIKELEDADIKVTTDVDVEIKAPTTYQMKFAYMTVMKYQNSFRKESECELIEKIPNVSENVWYVVRLSEEYNNLSENCNEILFNDQCIVIDGMSQEHIDMKTKFERKIRTIEEMELHEESVKGYKPEDIPKWVGNINKTFGYECCTFVKEKQMIIAACKNYDEVVKFKHLFGVENGSIRPTGRGKARNNRNENEEYSSLPVEQKPFPQSKNTVQAYTNFSWQRDSKNMQKYSTNESIEVFVYEADILKLPVECIVNAANERLQHGGGVAAVIARAAGHKMKEADEKYLREHTKLPVGMACKTAPGHLNYSFVIHTVGPDWSYYYPHNYEDVKRCETDLYNAIRNSFFVAEQNMASTIALPAISSAIFRVPEELCVHHYAKAVWNYSRKSTGSVNRLKQIHFIDKNEKIVRRIQKEFDCWFGDKHIPEYDSDKFVNTSSRHRKGKPDIGTRSIAKSHESGDMTSSQYNTKEENSNTPAELFVPLSFPNEWNSHTYHLCAKEKQVLHLNQEDIFKVKASAIVVTVNEKGLFGHIGSMLKSNIPSDMQYYYLEKIRSELKRVHEGDVFCTDGFRSRYHYVYHAVCSRSSRYDSLKQRKSKIRNIYSSIFDKCKRNEKVDSVAMTLMEIDCQKTEEIKMCSDAFLESYLQYCEDISPNKDSTLQVYLVCNAELLFAETKSVLDAYVSRMKEEKEKLQVPSNKDANGSGADQKHFEENSEVADCVICLETVSDPKTLDCGHTFCTECIDEQFKFKKACPSCGKVFGVITGNQPDGEMKVDIITYNDCMGYSGCGKIVITYNIYGGIQKENHPHPGRRYDGITRVAYLPNNEKGKQVLAMLKVAFNRKLVFTIGSSRTTGKEGVITWNDIHHKTDYRPNTPFGYPDPDYLDRVTDELAAKGITPKDIEDNQEFK